MPIPATTSLARSRMRSARLSAIVVAALVAFTPAAAQDARSAPEAATESSDRTLASSERHMVVAANRYAAEAGREILRAWMVDQELHCSLGPTSFDNATPWGLVLADVAKHVANALYEEHRFSVKASLDSIKYIAPVRFLCPISDISLFDRFKHCPGPIADAHFRENIRNVILDCPFGHV